MAEGRHSKPEGSPVKSNRDVVIRVKNLSKWYGGRSVLSQINLEVYRGEIVAIIGGSGSGKSTLLRHLLGLEKPDEGVVELLGYDVSAIGEEERVELCKRFGVLFQSGALFGSMTVGENVSLPLEEHTDLDPELREIVTRMKLDLVGLSHCMDLMPSELSGGMRKRAGLARAIVLDPEIMFYDEPQSGLDPVLTAVVDKLIADLNKHLRMTSVVVTHSIESALRYADRIYMLHSGRIVACGTPSDFKASEDPRVKQFLLGLVEGPLTEEESRKSPFSPVMLSELLSVEGGNPHREIPTRELERSSQDEVQEVKV